MTDLAFRCAQISFGNIFKDLSWDIPHAKTSVLMGSSGSGKSLLLRMLAGLTVPERGTVWRRDENIGMLFQKNALFDSMTAEENLLFTLRENLWSRSHFQIDQAHKEARELLHLVGLSQAADLYPSALSGGMQKRLGIARALIAHPNILLYDDPTAGLDPITSRSIAQVILDIQAKRNSTVVVVTNDRSRAFQLADEIFILTEKGILFAGDPQTARESKNSIIRNHLYGES